MELMGYRRPDGKVGIRNKVLILPVSVCATDTARVVASQVEGAVTFHNQNGCSQVPPDLQYTLDLMAGFAANPNIYGTIAISLGCETCQMDMALAEIRKRTNKPLKHFVIQENNGTINTIKEATLEAQKMVSDASQIKRMPFPISELIMGTECGGSDQTSGLASNPLIGKVSDRLVALGATSILSETTEFIGGEHILARRGKTPEVSARIFEIVKRYERSLQLVGEEVRKGNPSPGNQEGGLTTLEEKSLGCIHKGGESTINAVFDYAKPIDETGLVIMDTPGNDPSSVAGMAAGGAHLVVFSTGRGTPTGNPIVPVIKITGNKYTYENMSDNIDLDVSSVIYEPEAMQQQTDRLFDEVVAVVNGKKTKAELLGYIEIAIPRVCNYV